MLKAPEDCILRNNKRVYFVLPRLASGFVYRALNMKTLKGETAWSWRVNMNYQRQQSLVYASCTLKFQLVRFSLTGGACVFVKSEQTQGKKPVPLSQCPAL